MEATVQLGEQLFAQGKLEEAKACFLAVLETDANNVQALNDLGVVALNLGHKEEAQGHFLKALDLAPDYLDVRLNLSELLIQNEAWAEAAHHLEKALTQAPVDDFILDQLALALTKLGRTADLPALAANRQNIQKARELIDALWFNIKYWEMVEDLPIRDRLEGAIFNVLALIDGGDEGRPHFRLIADDPATGESITLECLREAFYYKQPVSLRLDLFRQKEAGPKLALPIERGHPHWMFFRLAMLREMSSEGGCQGTFRHSIAVLKREARLSKYDLQATLENFREKIGPCDCHLYRGTLAREE